ncbi:MAG: helix-turn-helix domain-containing protein [Frankiaceae bacterium]
MSTGHYRTLRLADGFAEAIEEQVATTLAQQQQLTRELHATLTKQLAKLEAREARLIDLAADGLLSRDKIYERSNAIQLERQRVQAGLADTGDQLKIGAERLRAAIALIRDVAGLYQRGDDGVRRQLNHTFYQRFCLDDDHGVRVAEGVSNPPFDDVQVANAAYERTRGSIPAAMPPPQLTSGPDQAAGPTEEGTPPRLADIFSVSVPSKRVTVELLGRYSRSRTVLERLQKTCRAVNAPRPRRHARPAGLPRHRVHKLEQRLSAEALTDLIAQHRAGESTRALAQAYGLSKSGVLHLLDRHGITRRYRVLSQGQVEEAQRLYEAGQSLARLGATFGCSPNTIRRALMRAGVPMRDPTQPQRSERPSSGP